MSKTILPPLLATMVLGLIGLFAVWTQEPWLAPSLGSAVFTQVMTPSDSSAKPANILAGQIIGAIAGFAGVFVAGVASAPPFFGAHTLLLSRVLALSVAACLACLAQLATGFATPAGGATALVVAVGAETASWSGFGHLAVGIVLVTLGGELSRRLVLRLQ